MTDVSLKNTNPIGAHRCGALGRTLEAGEVFAVSKHVAGRAPVHTVEEDGTETFDSGEGLLAQVGNYELVTTTGPTVDDLRKQLSDRGLETKGKKADLIARLAAADAAELGGHNEDQPAVDTPAVDTPNPAVDEDNDETKD